MKKGYALFAVLGITLVIAFVYFFVKDEKVTNIKIDDNYDVIVIGGEPEGVAAAVSAARNGAKTLLVEKRDALGGLFTYGMLNFLDIPQGVTGESVSKGIFQEWHELVGGKSSFGIQEAKDAFLKLVNDEPNLTLTTETEVQEVILDGNEVTAIKIKNASGTKEITGGAFIDATQDADIAVDAGVPYFLGSEDLGIEPKKMSVTLMMHFKNVDWDKFVKEGTDSFGGGEVYNGIAWGFPDVLWEYEPKEQDTRVRGLNIANVNNEIFINALQIFNVDGLNEKSKERAIELGKKETEHFLEFLQENLPGFEQAEIASFPTELYIRETRHIEAEYQLPMSDVWTNRDHWDSIAVAGYPVDIQAQTPEDYGHVVAHPEQYAIPFRSTVPKEIDGLLVVGRAAGYSSIAAGSARVVPTGMSVGEAAGVAANKALEYDMTFREISKDEQIIEEIRTTLANQGAFVEHFEIDYPYKGEWYDEAIQTLFDYGLVFGGYNNDLRVDEMATLASYSILLDGLFTRANPDIADQFVENLDIVKKEIKQQAKDSFTRDEAAYYIYKVLNGTDGEAPWDELVEQGALSEEVTQHIQSNKELSRKEMFAIAASVLTYLQSDNLN